MDRLDRLAERFERVARALPESVLQGEAGLSPEPSGVGFEAEILGELTHRESERLLGYYSQAGLEAAFEAYGIYDVLRARGYTDFTVELDLEAFAHKLRLRADGLPVAECVLRRARGAADPCFAEWQRRFLPDLLVVEWLTLGDPRAEFSASRPRLPGQTHPGSGIGAEIFVMLSLCARRLGLHGVLDVPQRFHNAVFYRRRTPFFDPEYEGHFLALLDLLDRHSLPELAWAMEEGRVLEGPDGPPVRWLPREQVLPLDGRLASYFDGPAWRRACARARRSFQPVLRPRAASSP